MRTIKGRDVRTNETTRLLVEPDNTISTRYFERTFRGATGIHYLMADLNLYLRSVIRK